MFSTIRSLHTPIALRPDDSLFPEQWRGLVGAWPLLEGGGQTAFDFGGRGRNGTTTNGPTWQLDRYGQALSFDGSDDRMTCGTTFDLTNATHSVSCWARSQRNGTFDVLCGWSRTAGAGTTSRMMFFKTDTNRFAIQRWYSGQDPFNDRFESNSTYSSGAFHHLGYSYNHVSGNCVLYVDGVADGSASSMNSLTLPDSDKTFAVGATYQNDTAWHFHGQFVVSGVAVYDRELRASDFAAIYAAGTNGYLIHSGNVLGSEPAAAAGNRRRRLLLAC